MSIRSGFLILALVLPVGVVPAHTQRSAQRGEWRFFGRSRFTECR